MGNSKRSSANSCQNIEFRICLVAYLYFIPLSNLAAECDPTCYDPFGIDRQEFMAYSFDVIEMSVKLCIARILWNRNPIACVICAYIVHLKNLNKP